MEEERDAGAEHGRRGRFMDEVTEDTKLAGVREGGGHH